MKINIDWVTYQRKYLSNSRTFVLEEDDKWILYSQDGIFVICCEVEKFADQTENMMFLERYFNNNPAIIKVQFIGDKEVEEEFPEDMFEEAEYMPEELEEIEQKDEVEENDDGFE